MINDNLSLSPLLFACFCLPSLSLYELCFFPDRIGHAFHFHNCPAFYCSVDSVFPRIGLSDDSFAQTVFLSTVAFLVFETIDLCN